MDHLFGVSRFCILLLWGCIGFLPQKGYNIAHSYSLNDSPQTSTQSHSGAFLNTNYEDKTQGMRHQGFVPLQREPVRHENRDDVTSFAEEMVQHKPDSGQEQEELLVVPSAPSVQKYERSEYQHPFGFLVKEHTPKKTVEGISFPTIKDFRHFIETMKSSFLAPGSDLSRHFQTARETMKNELTSGAENISRQSDSVTERSAYDDNSKNEVWSEPTNAVFEQGEPDTNYQKPRENLSFLDPADSTAGLISPSVNYNQDYGPVSEFYPHHNFAGTGHVSSNYGSLANGGISGENPDIFPSAPDVQNGYVESVSYQLPEQIPSYGNQATTSPVNAPNSPSQHISYYTGKTFNINPLNSQKTIPQPKHSLQQKPPSLHSYGKSLYVSAPRGQLHVPDNLPKHRERPLQSVQTYQPTVGKKSKNINYTPNVHLPVSTGSTSGHVGVEASSPHDLQHQVFSRKQPVRSHLTVFVLKPSSSLHNSSRHDGYLRNQSVSVSHPSSLSAHAKDEEISDLSKKNLVSAIQEPKQMNDNTPILTFGGLDSTQSGISSQVSDVYVSFNSPTNLAQTSEPKKTFSRLFDNEVMSRNFEIKNLISNGFPPGDIHGARNSVGLFSMQQRQDISPNDVFVSGTRAGLLQTFIQPTKVQKRPAKVNKGNMAHQPPEPLSASKVSGSTLSGVFWRNGGNTKTLAPQTGPDMSPPSVNTYSRKSRNSYVRGRVSLSKTHYTPYQHVEGNPAEDEWKPAPRKQTPPSVSHNVKGREEQRGRINTEIKWYKNVLLNILHLNITAVLVIGTINLNMKLKGFLTSKI